MARSSKSAGTNAQRAFFTFLMLSLVAPLLGAILATALAALSIVAGGLPGPWAGLPMSGLGQFFVAAFVWCTLPSAIAATGMAVMVAMHGTVGFLAAAAAGVVGFMVAAVAIPIPHGGLLPYLAFAAGLVAIFCRAILLRGRILTE